MATSIHPTFSFATHANQAPQKLSQQELARLKPLFQEDSVFERCSHGASASVFFRQDKTGKTTHVVRLLELDCSQQMVSQIYQNTEKISSLGACAPLQTFVPEQRALVFTYLEGTSFAKVREADQQDALISTIRTLVAKTLLTMEKADIQITPLPEHLSTDNFDFLPEPFSMVLQRYRTIVQDQLPYPTKLLRAIGLLERLYHVYQESGWHKSLTQGNLHPNNIFFTPDEKVLFTGYTTFGSGDPYFAIAKLCYTIGEPEAMLEEYLGRKPREEELEHLTTMKTLLELQIGVNRLTLFAQEFKGDTHALQIKMNEDLEAALEGKFEGNTLGYSKERYDVGIISLANFLKTAPSIFLSKID